MLFILYVSIIVVDELKIQMILVKLDLYLTHNLLTFWFISMIVFLFNFFYISDLCTQCFLCNEGKLRWKKSPG